MLQVGELTRRNTAVYRCIRNFLAFRNLQIELILPFSKMINHSLMALKEARVPGCYGNAFVENIQTGT